MKAPALATVRRLFLHPVKGLTPHEVSELTLEAGFGIPGDRAFAFLFEDCDPDPGARTVPWEKKFAFAMQNDWPALAALRAVLDPGSATLSLFEGGRPAVVASTVSDEGRAALGDFVSRYLARQAPHPKARHPKASRVRLVGEAPGGGRVVTRYPDRDAAHVSLLNEGSLRAVETSVGASLDIRRFRGNIIVDGLAPWAELDLVGKRARLGGCRLLFGKGIVRCPNVSVEPETGDTGTDVFTTVVRLAKGVFGILATVEAGGPVRVGDTLVLE